jgi:hypothetical protein
LYCANPTLKQMARHWFYSFGTNPNAESFVHSRARFWLIDSDCLRHMTGDKGWFSSLIPVVSRTYITFGDNGRGRVLSEGEIKVRSRLASRLREVQSPGIRLMVLRRRIPEVPLVGVYLV